MIRWIAPPLAVLIAIAITGCGGEPERATAGVPQTFFGIAPQDATSDADRARMAAGNVGSYHVLLSWAKVEASPGVYSWSTYDDLLAGLAVNGIDPIAYVFGTPLHFADTPNIPPTTSVAALKAWDDFLAAAVARYGPGGEFWDSFALSHPGVEPRPLTVWEIWNEVNSPTFWAPDPDPDKYATLLKRSARTIHKVDPSAQIMVAGMFATPNSTKAIQSFEFLRELFKKPNVDEAVDLVAVHPYGPHIKDVKRQMARTYEQMKNGGNGEDGVWVTEIGWGSNPSVKSELTKTAKKQAVLLRKAYELLIKKRDAWNVQGALWYTWRDPANPVGRCGWCRSAGLVDNDLDGKPAWREYAKLSGGTP